MIVLKYDVEGNFIWRQKWKNNVWDPARGITATNEYIYLTGKAENDDMILLRYDTDGNHILTSLWGGNKSDFGNGIIIVGDYAYLTGGTESYGNGDSDILFMKILMDSTSPNDTILHLPTDITNNSLTLSWDENIDNDFSYYKIYMSMKSGEVGSSIEMIDNKKISSYHVSGLTSSTSYYFSIRVYDVCGLYSESNQWNYI